MNAPLQWRQVALAGAKPLLLLMVFFTLSGCDPQQDIVVKLVCLRINEYDQKTQDRALAEYNALPPDSALRLMLGDYKRLRDQVRICREKGSVL